MSDQEIPRGAELYHCGNESSHLQSRLVDWQESSSSCLSSPLSCFFWRHCQKVSNDNTECQKSCVFKARKPHFRKWSLAKWRKIPKGTPDVCLYFCSLQKKLMEGKTKWDRAFDSWGARRHFLERARSPILATPLCELLFSEKQQNPVD